MKKTQNSKSSEVKANNCTAGLQVEHAQKYLKKFLAENSKLSEILRVKSYEDLEIAVNRIFDIAKWVPKYKMMAKSFDVLKEEKQVEFAKKMVNLYHLVYHKVNFEKEYRKLSVNDRQAAVMQILSLYKYGDKRARVHKLSDEKRKFFWSKFVCSMADSGAYIDRKFHAPVDQNEKKIIRWDCYGLIEEPQEKHLSQEYRLFLKNRCPAPIRKNFKYDLMTSPVFAYNFAQFKNFAEISDMFQESLRYSNIPVSLLPELNAYDFANIICKRYKDSEYETVSLFQGSKFEFVKYIGCKYEKEISEAHKAMGVDERYTRSLLREMKMKGHSSDITPLEYIATREQLDELTALGIDCKGIKPGDVYSDEFCMMLFQKDAYEPLIARDIFGDKITGPDYDVDHKSPVDDAGGNKVGDFPNIQAANNWTNFRLVERNMHKMFIHALDVTQVFGKEEDKEEAYISRLQLPDNNIVMVFGVDKSRWISHDVSRHPYLLDQLKYFNESYLPEIKRAENFGKVSYVEHSIVGKESEVVNKDGEKYSPNRRMIGKAISDSRRRRR